MIRFGRNGQSDGIAVVVLACLAAVSNLTAQTATGRIIGTLTDPTGAVIPGATITVTNVETQVTTQTITNEQGYYQVLLLPIGTYTVSGELPGFQKAVTKPEKLEINQSLRVDIKMVVGNRTEEVLVEEGISHVDTVTPTLGASVIGEQIANMPLNGRNVLDLALLVPGVVPAAPRSRICWMAVSITTC
jgi:Carboxypeptidase regulatory-like domain